MTQISRRRSLRLLLFFSSISIPFFAGLCDDSSGSKNTETHANSSKKAGTGVAIILLGVVAILLVGVFLFKLWQKKKRDEQYARLLKLFEEDDELEVELGLRD